MLGSEHVFVSQLQFNVLLQMNGMAILHPLDPQLLLEN